MLWDKIWQSHLLCVVEMVGLVWNLLVVVVSPPSVVTSRPFMPNILANNALRAHHASAHGGLSANGLSDICLIFF